MSQLVGVKGHLLPVVVTRSAFLGWCFTLVQSLWSWHCCDGTILKVWSSYIWNDLQQLVFGCVSVSLSLSVRFNGHFPGEPVLASVYWSKGWWRWWWQLNYWSYKSCKAPVKSSTTDQHPVFLQVGCHSCRPNNSVKALKGKYYIPWTHLRVFRLCIWPLIAPGYRRGGLPCLSSALRCQYPRFLDV